MMSIKFMSKPSLKFMSKPSFCPFSGDLEQRGVMQQDDVV